MKTVLATLALLPSLALATDPPKPPSVMPEVAPMSAAECSVWEREKSFAASVENHDARAFAEHVQAGATFINGNQAPTRGRDGVLADWKAIIAGEGRILRWSPGFVLIGGDAHVAVSRGPYWIDNPDPKAASRYAVGDFQSIWVKDPDGVWRVLVDGGTAPPRPSTAEEVEALKKQLPATCPKA